jgi:hypothetical protein
LGDRAFDPSGSRVGAWLGRILKMLPTFYLVLEFGGPISARESACHFIEQRHEAPVWATNLARGSAKLGKERSGRCT